MKQFFLLITCGLMLTAITTSAQTRSLTWRLNEDTLTVSGNKYPFAKDREPTKVGYASMASESETGYSATQGEPPFAKDRVLVQLANTPAMQARMSGPGTAQRAPDLGVGFSELRLLNPSKGNTNIGHFSTMNVNDKQNNVYVLTLKETGENAVERALKILNANPAVEIAEPVFYYTLYTTPNDPLFPQQYALNKINALQAWEMTTGSNSVVVGIIDSGIDGTQPDLSDNLWTNPNPNQGGYVNDIHGYDFVYRRSGTPADMGTHGTHVAGIIGAKGNNGTGITGVNWNVSLAWLGIGIDGMYVSSDAAIEALNYANNHHIKITNNSWGGEGYSALLEDAIRNYNGLFVAAAGNNGTNNDNRPFYPSAYNLPNLIAVASTDPDDNRSPFSNYGANSVHIAAPGSAVLSTIVNGQYQEMSGTSMAAPHVTGVAALMLSVNPNATASHLKSVLIHSADTITMATPYDGTQQIGRLNASKAIRGILTSVQDLTSGVSGYSVTLNWQAPIDATGLLGYRVYRDATLLTPANIPALTYTDTHVPNGIYTYTVTAVYANGETASHSLSVTAGYIITITTQPAANTLVVDGSITGSLSVAATVTQGIPLSYQWYSNIAYNNEGGTPIGGATHATFDIPATLTPGIYYYFCEVSAVGATAVRSKAATVGVAGIGPVPYLDENGHIQNVEATTLTGAETTLIGGWYFVPSDITYSERLTISTPDNSTVVIILGDNAHMDARNGGINVGEGNNLRIYAQSEGANSGRLTANGGADQAGIGGNAQSAGGSISIVGGRITANGGGLNSGGGSNGGAGIGGGGGYDLVHSPVFGWSGGAISISGGEVYASGSWGGSGIGCGGGSWSNTEGSVSLTGGTITARGGNFAGYGIGGVTISAIGGNAVLISSSIDYDYSIQPALPAGDKLGSAIVYDNGMGTMYGHVSLARNVTTPASSSLFVCNGQTLTIQSGYTLINDGAIIVNGGSVVGAVAGNLPAAPALTVSGSPAYNYSCSGVLAITGNGTYRIGMRDGASLTTSERIAVLPGVNADITLSDVNIDLSSHTGLSAFDMTGANVNLTLTGTNVLRSGNNRAGLEAPLGSNLLITEASTGSLTVFGGNYGAGIGGRGGGWTPGIATCGHIHMAGGTLTATGGFAGAGIGDGQNAQSNGEISISGGTLTAIGGLGSAGIGGGQAGNSVVTIHISGGTVTATGSTVRFDSPNIGAGIGGGNSNGATAINITGGAINAQCTNADVADDIGTGQSAAEIPDISISITGGSVLAANNRISDRWADETSRYPVKVTVLDSSNGKTDGATVVHSNYTGQILTGGNYATTDFTTPDPGVAWLWLPAGSQTIGANKDTSGGSNTVDVLPSGDNNDISIVLTTGDIAVYNITNLPAEAIAGTPLTLSGTVQPINATHQTIEWSIVDAGTTGATVSGHTFNATATGTATVRATIANGLAQGISYTQNSIIQVSYGTSIATRDAPLARIYPNPTDGRFTLQLNATGKRTVTLSDLSGKTLLRRTETDRSIQMDISNYPSGLYLLAIDDCKQLITMQIVKN
ncbi:MAG: S8 family serine peptidase [Dysgonamonadaceae bacterium]|jgi:hypothetical protein|nr:S8 family serine peptidase [Dysgonamonadaceae bacterium]